MNLVSWKLLTYVPGKGGGEGEGEGALFHGKNNYINWGG